MALLLNGRFLTRPPTGVDRVAVELMRAFLARDDAPELRCVVPQPGPIQELGTFPDALIKSVEISESILKGQLWEQVSLPRLAAEETLLSLCNIGPIASANQVVMMHDAQAFTQPQAYARAFRMWYHAVQPRLGRKVRLVLTVSRFSAGELEAHGVVPRGKARVVHNGADHILRTAADPETLTDFTLEPQGYFLAIGSFAPHKNLKMLIAAAERRGAGAPPVVIAGGGNARVFGENGLRESASVRLLGRVSDAQLRALYENALALTFPSLTEGFGLPPVEAMTCGCPVIAAPRGAVPEICGSAARYADPEDAQAWTVAMQDIADNQQERKERAEAGRAQSAAFTWQAAAAQFAAHLDEAGLLSSA
ncbi:glycosyltransferase family 1 protein [Shimia sp. R9_3]|uniref:glycosyltransferase family 4 protein n=1 Tax=Shimia sp. R9_3 TaxID=2821113 RepID=UPI001ADBCB17|nr:glycosyltransferase family 1 protein [Shimia sp. R9_3]